MIDKLNELLSSDNNKAFSALGYLELECTKNDSLYQYFDFFLDLIKHEKSFVRIRGFRMICALAPWDRDNKIGNNIDTILSELDDKSGTAIRQCLKYVTIILLYKPELSDALLEKLNRFNYSDYKESMASLIKRDIDDIIKHL